MMASVLAQVIEARQQVAVFYAIKSYVGAQKKMIGFKTDNLSN